MAAGFMTQYHPLTSRPFLRNRTYEEHPPCQALRPYIACFWSSEGTGESGAGQRVLVIPDTCVDIIIETSRTGQRIRSRLCGIQDYSVMAGGQADGSEEIICFAVRFYFWAARLFLDLNLSDICNQTLDFDLIQPGCNSRFEALFYRQSVGEKIAWMESYLLGILNPGRYDHNLYNSIDYLLRTGGSAPVKDICSYSTVSQRQMERLFRRDIGISIKRTASLVRYQNVWREVVRQESFNVQEAVYRYGYADQSHLLNEFKRFHGLLPDQAKKKALEQV